MHYQRQRRRERGTAITHRDRRSILAVTRWVIRSCRATKVNRETDRVMQRVVIVHRIFHRQNRRHVIQSTIERRRQQSKGNVAYGISGTLASWTQSCNAWVKPMTCQSSHAHHQHHRQPLTKAQHHRRKTVKSGQNSANWFTKCGRPVHAASTHRILKWHSAANTECTADQHNKTLKSFCVIFWTLCMAHSTPAGRKFRFTLTMRWGNKKFSLNFSVNFQNSHQFLVTWRKQTWCGTGTRSAKAQWLKTFSLDN